MKFTFPTINRTVSIVVVIIVNLVVLLALVMWLIRTHHASWSSAGIAAYVISILVLILWWVPKVQASSLSAKGVNAKDVFKAENDARVTLAQILGGFAVLTGLYFAWQNITTTAKNLELANKNLELAKEGQVTERFTRAIEQLGVTDDKAGDDGGVQRTPPRVKHRNNQQQNTKR